MQLVQDTHVKMAEKTQKKMALTAEVLAPLAQTNQHAQTVVEMEMNKA